MSSNKNSFESPQAAAVYKHRLIKSYFRKEALMARSDQVLDELTELTAVEHAVIAEYLQIAYVLGHRLPDPAPGPAGPAIADAAQKILSMAQFVEMKHLKLVNEYLVASGRPAQLDQAVGIDHSLGSGAMTVFGPLREDDLLALVERETALAKAVDARYARLRPEVDPEDRGLGVLGRYVGDTPAG